MSRLINTRYSLATVFQVVASEEFHANDGEEIVEENQNNGHTERSKVSDITFGINHFLPK